MKTGLVLAMMLFLLACNNKKVDTKDTLYTTDTSQITIRNAPQEPKEDTAFNIDAIPVSNKLEGTFPYFILPPGYVITDPKKFHGKGETKDYDKEYFYVHGVYRGVEGKTFKGVIRVAEEAKDKKFSQLEIQKSFDDIIERSGGIKLNNGEKLKEGQADKIEKDAYTNGYLNSGSTDYNVHTYVIRTADKEVWVQFDYLDNASRITVLETRPFKNEMTIVPASQMKKEIEEKGKAILYIHFDTDKATLQPDGQKTVDEIAKLVNEDPSLKLSIEGHTDDTGNASRNKELSLKRAQTVMNSLLAQNIDKARLRATGFGAEKPLLSNDTEQNKAKNRRVELVKM
jgi:OmpA-OmpF porin, OOP family